MYCSKKTSDPSVSLNSHLQHLTAITAASPDHDPVRSQTRCGVTQCRTDAQGACLHHMTPEPKSCGSDSGEDRWDACRSVHLRERGVLKKGSLSRLRSVCICVWKAAAVSYAIKERPPDTHPGIHSHRMAQERACCDTCRQAATLIQASQRSSSICSAFQQPTHTWRLDISTQFQRKPHYSLTEHQ